MRDLETALNKFDITDPDNRLISLHPAISFDLDRRHIPHATTLDYGGSAERYRAGIASYGAVEKLLDEIDGKFPGGHINSPVTPAKYSFYYIKILFDGVQANIHLLKEIISREKPENIITFGCTPSQHQDLIPFRADEPVFAQLLALEGWGVPVSCFIAEKTVPTEKPCDVKEPIFRNFVTRNTLLFNMAMMVRKRRGMLCLVSAIVSSFLMGKSPLVIYESGGNWDDALEELYRAGFHPILRYRHEKCIGQGTGNQLKIQESIETICKESEFISNLAMMYGIDTRPIFFGKLSAILARTFRESDTEYRQFSTFLQHHHPLCLLILTQAYHLDRTAIKAAHDYGIQVFSWQHGGGGYYYHPIMPFAEFIDSDAHLVYGEAVKASYHDTARKLQIPKIPDFFPVGSSSLDCLAREYREKIGDRKTISVLYITTFYRGIASYISDPSDQSAYNEKLWGVQKTLFETARANPRMDFVVKLHPVQINDLHIARYVAGTRARNVTMVIGEKTIPQLLDDADVIVFDLISTGILQVLHTKKPIFVYSGLEDQDRIAIDLLKKRAFVYDSIVLLTRDLEEYAGSASQEFAHRRGVDYANTEFLREYGTGKNDGNSAERAAQIVRKLVILGHPSR